MWGSGGDASLTWNLYSRAAIQLQSRGGQGWVLHWRCHYYQSYMLLEACRIVKAVGLGSLFFPNNLFSVICLMGVSHMFFFWIKLNIHLYLEVYNFCNYNFNSHACFYSCLLDTHTHTCTHIHFVFFTLCAFSKVFHRPKDFTVGLKMFSI